MVGFERAVWCFSLTLAAALLLSLARENARLDQRLKAQVVRHALTETQRARQWELLGPAVELHHAHRLNGLPAERFEELLELADEVVKTPAIAWYVFDNPAEVREGGGTRNLKLTVLTHEHDCPRIVYASQPVYVP